MAGESLRSRPQSKELGPRISHKAAPHATLPPAFRWDGAKTVMGAPSRGWCE